MKKISLKSLNLKEVEQLTREQLKNVIGGYTGGTGDVTDDGGTGSGTADDPCPHAGAGDETTECQVKIDGQWRTMGVAVGYGMSCGQHYVAEGWATNYCCDSCP